MNLQSYFFICLINCLSFFNISIDIKGNQNNSIYKCFVLKILKSKLINYFTEIIGKYTQFEYNLKKSQKLIFEFNKNEQFIWL